MASEILTLKGESDGTNTSGDFPLYSDLLYHDTEYHAADEGSNSLRNESQNMG
jgi:hypothetical protein